jgi:hypothetical protein
MPTSTRTSLQYPDCPVLAPRRNWKKSRLSHIARANVNYLSAAMLASNTIPLPNSYQSAATLPITSAAVPLLHLASVSPATYWREELFRIDHNLTPTEQLAFRYVHDSWNTTTLTPQWGVVQNSFPTVENKLIGPGLDMVFNISETLPHGILNRATLAYSVAHISLAPQPGPGVTSLARPAILDNAGTSVTGGKAVTDSSGNPVPGCSAVTGATSTPPNPNNPPAGAYRVPHGPHL